MVDQICAIFRFVLETVCVLICAGACVRLCHQFCHSVAMAAEEVAVVWGKGGDCSMLTQRLPSLENGKSSC